MRLLFSILCIICIFTSCDEPVFTPKPRGYPRVDYPEKAYQPFTEDYCGFTFDYPKYATIQQDVDFFDEKPLHPCWFDIYLPDFEGRIYCSYIPIDKDNTLDKLKRDAFNMTDWHTKRATYIDEFPIKKDNGVKGMLFKVEGPAASPMQFFLTDSLGQEHFLRGALYFDTKIQPDSLAPIYDFVTKDVEKMLATFEWK